VTKHVKQHGTRSDATQFGPPPTWTKVH